MTDEAEGVAIPVTYVGADDVTVIFGNTFVVQLNQDEFILGVGQLIPPMLMGDPEAVREQARHVSSVPVRILARYGMTVARARELRELLDRQLELYERVKGQGGKGAG